MVLKKLCLAQAALRDTSVVFKLRPLSEATTASKQTARLHLGEFFFLLRPQTKSSQTIELCVLDCLQPFKPRPETSALLARRMVEGHLGMKTRISPEQRTHERKKLQAAKGNLGLIFLILAVVSKYLFLFRAEKRATEGKSRCLGRKRIEFTPIFQLFLAEIDEVFQPVCCEVSNRFN